MSARDLQIGDHFTPAGYRIDLTIVGITDHTGDAIGHVILEDALNTVIYTGLGDDGWPYDVIEGVEVRIGGVA